VPELGHVVFYVRSLDRSLEFYRDVVGMRPLFVAKSMAFFDGGGVALALNQYPGELPQDPGMTEVVLEVDDVDATYAELRDRGVVFRVEPRPVTESEGRTLYAADFRDPDGHVLSVTGWKQSS